MIFHIFLFVWFGSIHVSFAIILQLQSSLRKVFDIMISSNSFGQFTASQFNFVATKYGEGFYKTQHLTNIFNSCTIAQSCKLAHLSMHAHSQIHANCCTHTHLHSTPSFMFAAYVLLQVSWSLNFFTAHFTWVFLQFLAVWTLVRFKCRKLKLWLS